MEIYLIRHGIAAERGTYTDDAERPLVKEGRSKTARVAKRLGDLGVNFEVILTSPLVRAQETALILQDQGLSDRLEIFEPLTPQGQLEAWLDWYKQQQPRVVALVGHQPDLGDWAETLVWGSSKSQILLKKAGIIGIKTPPGPEIRGKCQLFLLTSPKWFI